MKGYTKKALQLFMITQMLAIVVALILYLSWYSFTPSDISSGYSRSPILLIPIAVIGIIAAIIGLIGAVLFLMGSKEFGELHKRFVFYAVFLFIIYVITMMVITIFTSILTFSYVSQYLTNPNTTFTTEVMSQILSVMLITSPIVAIISGLIWVFGLYQLENRTGRVVLFSVYLWMIAIAIFSSISSYLLFNDWINSGYFQNLLNNSSANTSSYSQLFSSSQWIGTTGVISLAGSLIQSILFFVALYIPYQRITSGELIALEVNPLSSFTNSSSDHQQRRCPNCGRIIPFDAHVCPYCGRKFES